jgi:hypothetical protein
MSTRTTHRTRVAGLITATVVAGAALIACGTEDDTAADPGDGATSSAPTSPATSAEPSGTASTDPTPTETGGTGEPVAVPAYFVGDTPLGQRLFREFRNVPADSPDGPPVDQALALLTSGDALDPDYSTLLPTGTLTVAGQGTTIDVALPDASWAQAPAGTTPEQAALAVQQVVHTVQGALQQQLPVTFTLDGAASPVLGLTAPEGGFVPGEFTDEMALVNVTAPAEGDTVSGSFTASGVASSFEGTVPWELRDASGTAVVKGSAQADGWLDALYPWESTVDLTGVSPGTYTFVAMTDDPSGGEGGGPTEDTRTVTVQ